MKGAYKRRRLHGADRYGSFDNGKQRTADIIGGVTVWHEWKSVASDALS